MKYTQSTMLITLVLITLFGATLLYQSSIESDVRMIEPLAEKLITDQADDARLPQQALVVEADRPTAPRVELWQTAVEIPAEQIPIIRKDVDGAVLVELDRETMTNLQEGDRVTLLVPQANRSFTFYIKQVKTHKSGNKTLKGNLDLPHERYSVVITLGQDTTFATLNTPLGQYNLIGTAKAAWIIKAQELNKHIDYERPDFVATAPVSASPAKLREKPPSN